MSVTSTANRFRGVVVPMMTPFTAAGSIDTPAVGRLVEHLLADAASDGIFPLGTTGESSSIPFDDKIRLVREVVRLVGDRATVYAGIASNCFTESVALAKSFADLGVAAVVAHPPAYYPLDDDEIEAYFDQLAAAVPLPLVLYNIPATTRHAIALDSVDKLRRHQNVVAIKDSAGDANRITELLKRCGGRGGFPVLLGSSPIFPAGLRAGGVGLVPSGSHLVPKMYQRMMRAADAGDFETVDACHLEASKACEAYLAGRSLSRSLAQLKFLLEQKGLCSRHVLPPLRTIAAV